MLIINIEKGDIMKLREQRILDMLKEKEMHGFEIVVKLNKNPETSFESRIGTLYPILKSLEKRRFIKAYEIKKDGKSRIYYRRTMRSRRYGNES